MSFFSSDLTGNSEIDGYLRSSRATMDGILRAGALAQSAAAMKAIYDEGVRLRRLYGGAAANPILDNFLAQMGTYGVVGSQPNMYNSGNYNSNNNNNNGYINPNNVTTVYNPNASSRYQPLPIITPPGPSSFSSTAPNISNIPQFSTSQQLSSFRAPTSTPPVSSAAQPAQSSPSLLSAINDGIKAFANIFSGVATPDPAVNAVNTAFTPAATTNPKSATLSQTQPLSSAVTNSLGSSGFSNTLRSYGPTGIPVLPGAPTVNTIPASTADISQLNDAVRRLSRKEDQLQRDQTTALQQTDRNILSVAETNEIAAAVAANNSNNRSVFSASQPLPPRVNVNVTDVPPVVSNAYNGTNNAPRPSLTFSQTAPLPRDRFSLRPSVFTAPQARQQQQTNVSQLTLRPIQGPDNLGAATDTSHMDLTTMPPSEADETAALQADLEALHKQMVTQGKLNSKIAQIGTAYNLTTAEAAAARQSQANLLAEARVVANQLQRVVTVRPEPSSRLIELNTRLVDDDVRTVGQILHSFGNAHNITQRLDGVVRQAIEDGPIAQQEFNSVRNAMASTVAQLNAKQEADSARVAQEAQNERDIENAQPAPTLSAPQ